MAGMIGVMGKEKMGFTDTIRAAVRECPLGYNGLARAAGLDPGALHHFAHGKRGMSAPNMDKLAEALGLEIVVDKRKRKGGRS